MMKTREIHIELLLGRRVYGMSGRSAGCIEEIVAEQRDGEWRVTEYLIGPDAMITRFTGKLRDLGIVRGPMKRLHRGYRVPWKELDLSNPERPTLRCSVEELEAI
jgi:sporulation protein YlmC with PRC-barrel domain